ncbi:DUF3347 domain-containing protein [Aquimarina longa]|uniref:DUF3347 domain-containing protein n=1 Tax=Aquimarina longa TaxID=1080221 RepID=UPI0009E9C231|nr:DUF3347 domain-containing protein [Aquimarina longa]
MKLFFKAMILILVVITSCKTDKKPEPYSEEELNNEAIDLDTTDSRSEVKFSDIKDQEVYDLYLSIKKALVNSKSKEVQVVAKKIEIVLGDTEEDKQLKATSKLISITKDIKKQRDFFVSLTNEVEKRINKSNIISGEIYKQFCPMAFGGEGGYWLSDSKEIRNPYFGNKMLVCGRVEKIVK